MHHISINSLTQNIFTDTYHVSGPVLGTREIMMKVTKISGRRPTAGELRFLKQLAELSSAPTKPYYPMQLKAPMFSQPGNANPNRCPDQEVQEFRATNVEGA